MNKSYFLVLLFLYIFSSVAFGQYEAIEEVKTFGSRINNPIKVNGNLKDNKEVVFFAENISNYPYVVEIKFNNLQNLQPYITNRRVVVYPGNHKLLSFTIKDPEQGIDYKYSFKYKLGGINKEPDNKYPYLFPMSEGRSVIPYKRYPKSKSYLINHFVMAEKDTIYCMRKGFVSVTPQIGEKGEKISKTNSIEILHQDGTVMVYENIDRSVSLVKLGKTVYPGQAIGCVNGRKYLRVYLVSLNNKEGLKSIPFLYTKSENDITSFDNSFFNLNVVHPKEIVTKEMSKRELKRVKKGKIIL